MGAATGLVGIGEDLGIGAVTEIKRTENEWKEFAAAARQDADAT